MSRQVTDREYRRFQTGASLLYLLLLGLFVMASARADDGAGIRQSTSTSIASGGRDGGGESVLLANEHPAMTVEGERVSPGRMADRANSDRPETARLQSWDFWIYDADVLLFGDDDNDGYFYGIDLLFDADTIWDSARVYAVTYLSLNGGPWNEYAVTEDFIINGAVSDDEYVLVTELESGYPTGSYDLLIELYDSATGEFLADFGPESNSSLGFLALEDFNRDAPFFDQPVARSRGSGGGATGLILSVLLAGALVLRRRAA